MIVRAPRTAGLALLAALLAGNGVAGTNRWTNPGPPGDWVTGIAVAPSEPTVTYATTLDGGVLKTLDSGKTWSWTTLTGFEGFALLVDPNDPMSLLVATNDGLWKTSDGGTHWTRDASAGRYVASLARNPSRPSVVVASGTEGTFVSLDGGGTWRAAGQNYFPKLAIDGRTGAIFGGGYGPFSRSTDLGRTWSLIGQGVIRNTVSAIAVDGLDPTIYAATFDGIARSLDGGDHWEAALLPQPIDIRSIAADPSQAGVAYASTLNGVLKTADRGKTWTSSGSGIAGFVTSLFVASSGNPVYAGTWKAGMFLSRDSGNSWVEANAGFGASRIWALAIDPLNPRSVLAGGTDGLFRTEDGGASWSRSGAGLERTGAIESLAIDSNPTTAYAVGQFVCPSAFPCDAGASVFLSLDRGSTWQETSLRGHVRLLADPRRPGVVYAGSSYEVYRSGDAAGSWSKISTLPTSVFDLFADPLDPSVLWAATGSGAYVSSDGGVSWRIFGFAGEAIQTIVPDPSNRLRVYVLKYYPPSTSSLFRTSDGGLTWRAVNGGLPDLPVSALALDPGAPSTLYAVLAVPSSSPPQPTVGGVFRSIDRGERWEPFNFGIVHRYGSNIAIDSSGRFLYAVLYGGGVYSYRVSDSGPHLFLDPADSRVTADGCRTFTLAVQPPRPGAVTITLTDSPAISTPESVTLFSTATFSACGVRASVERARVTATLPDSSETAIAEISVVNPVPRILQISPTAARAGTPGMLFRVFDRNSLQFGIEGATILWNGSPRATVRRDFSPFWLETTLTAEDLAQAGSASVAVAYPAPGGGVSATRTFVIEKTEVRSDCSVCLRGARRTRTTGPGR